MSRSFARTEIDHRVLRLRCRHEVAYGVERAEENKPARCDLAAAVDDGEGSRPDNEIQSSKIPTDGAN